MAVSWSVRQPGTATIWTMSPPMFSAMSETTTDVANHRFQQSPWAAPTHRLSPIAEEGDDLDPSPIPRPREPEQLEATNKLRKVVGLPPLDANHVTEDEAAPTSNIPWKKPLGRTDVFVDDFIQLGQGGPARMDTNVELEEGILCRHAHRRI